MANVNDLEQLTGVKEQYAYGFHDNIQSVFQTERG